MAVRLKTTQAAAGVLSNGQRRAVVPLLEGQVPGDCYCEIATEGNGRPGEPEPDLEMTALVEHRPNRVVLERSTGRGRVSYAVTVKEVAPSSGRVEQAQLEIGTGRTFGAGLVDSAEAARAILRDYARRKRGRGLASEYVLSLTRRNVVRATRSAAGGGRDIVIGWVVHSHLGAPRPFAAGEIGTIVLPPVDVSYSRTRTMTTALSDAAALRYAAGQIERWATLYHGGTEVTDAIAAIRDLADGTKTYAQADAICATAAALHRGDIPDEDIPVMHLARAPRKLTDRHDEVSMALRVEACMRAVAKAASLYEDQNASFIAERRGQVERLEVV